MYNPTTPYDRAAIETRITTARELAGVLDLHIGDCSRLVREVGPDHARELAFRALMES